MREIDMQTWARRDHFRFFGGFDQPQFAMCANVDITGLQALVKARGYTFTVAVVYLITRAANAVPEFRYRIRGEKVVEHEVVHPSFTILVEGDLFAFCDLAYREPFSEFAVHAAERIAHVKQHPSLRNEPGKDDVLYMTSLPWVSFTSFLHPLPTRPVDSVPRFAWGKAFEEGGRLKMPLGMQAHHAVMDGLHMARCYQEMEKYLARPEAILEGGSQGS